MIRIIFILFVPILSFSQISSCEDMTFEEMFLKAASNYTTAPNYVVICATNNKTGEIKEICLESMNLYEVINPEFKEIKDLEINYNNDCIASFSFSNKETLEKIGFDRYQIEIVDSLSKYMPPNTIKLIEKEYRKGEYKLVENYIEEYSIYFLHYLFRNKILTHRDCESGYIYIDKIY